MKYRRINFMPLMVKRTKIFIYTSVYLVLFDVEAVQITSTPAYLSNY